MNLSSYQFRFMYESMGVNWDDPGCVMLKTQAIYMDAPGLEDDLYYSDTQKYAQGQVGAVSPHVTLLYGLLPPTKRENVDIVLEGWSLPEIEVKDILVFEPPGQEYSVVVADVFHPKLLEAHQRLSFLPHINTHPEYKPHVTLAYVKRGHESLAVKLSKRLIGASLPTMGLDYGDLESL